MKESLIRYYRCLEQHVSLFCDKPLSEDSGYFKFDNLVLYGGLRGGKAAKSVEQMLRVVYPERCAETGTMCLPFDATQVVNSLRYETYMESSARLHPASSLSGRVYYFLRPIFPVSLRRHLQKYRLSGWRSLRFPNWPVDNTVDTLLERLLLMSIRAGRLKEIPFIWFWPNGASSCAIMTHDVETRVGRDFCPRLMDVDSQFGIRASFQLVPESRYEVSDGFLEDIRNRDFEINVQDLNHDGHLFRDRKEFLSRVVKINHYGRQFGADGFRSAILYRRQEWYDALQFSYDMSVPNVAHLDPQRGGCCTVMPYFVGNIVELPVTATQDYSLFHILEDHSIDLWKDQIDIITAKHGLIHFVTHPDYITGREEMATYRELLGYMTRMAAEQNIWMPLPGEVASWWKKRAQLKLSQVNGCWRIEGEGGERARIAYASEMDGQLVYSFQPSREATECNMVVS